MAVIFVVQIVNTQAARFIQQRACVHKKWTVQIVNTGAEIFENKFQLFGSYYCGDGARHGFGFLVNINYNGVMRGTKSGGSSSIESSV